MNFLVISILQKRSRWLLLKTLIIEILRMIEVAIESCFSFLALHYFSFELNHEKKYCYLTKDYYLKDQLSLLKKQCINEGKTKNLTYQLLWIQSKRWHVYSKELQGGLCKVCWLFDQISGYESRGKFVKTLFQDVGKCWNYVHK